MECRRQRGGGGAAEAFVPCHHGEDAYKCARTLSRPCVRHLSKKTTSLEHYTINSLAPFCTLSQGGGLPRSDRPCVPCFRCCPSGRGRPCRAPVLLRTLSTAAAATGRRSAAHLTTIASSTAPMIVQLRHGLCTYAAYVPCVEHSTPLPPQHCREGRAPRGSRRKPSYPRSPLLLDARALRARARAACSTSSSGR